MDDILEKLNDDKTILYPTDTVWGLGCDALSENAVKNIYKLKQRSESKALIILVNSIKMLQQYVTVNKKVLKLLENIEKPTTIIYQNPKGLANNLINKDDNSVAIRVVKDEFCELLIKQLGKPIVSTSANISGSPTPKCFKEIEPAILNGVDYVVNSQTKKKSTKSSTILKIEGDDIVVIRE